MTLIDRRSALKLAGFSVLGVIASACSGRASDEESFEASSLPLEQDAGAGAGDASAADAGDAGDGEAPFVILYDTYAQALYLDGSYGPKTGIIKVADIAAGADKLYDFWHGHGGRLHRFTLTAAHFGELKKKKRAIVTTTVVDNHQHTLFVDPVDLRWRVPGAVATKVPL
jgi:hypothetical protein